MVVVNITSGLGNQLFQYAFGKHLAERNNTPLYFNLGFYKSEYSLETQRVFKLNNFVIDFQLIERNLTGFFVKAQNIFPNRRLTPVYKYVKESQYHFDPNALSAKALCVTTEGYWNSEKYFEDISSKIREELIFNFRGPDKLFYFEQLIKSCPQSVSIHIRRGDYVHHPEFSKTFGFLGLEYYERAIKFIQDRIDYPSFFVFTDDKKWVMDNLQVEAGYTLVDIMGENGDLSDMKLMSLCKHNIIANSTFSWWGAWLNSNLNKVVVAPTNWFRYQPNWDTKDLLPASWVKL